MRHLSFGSVLRSLGVAQFFDLTGMLATPTLSLGGGSVADLWSSKLLEYPIVTHDGATAFGTFCGMIANMSLMIAAC